ncbi:MAG: hypothetical protein GX672_05175, partial [Synergistaceae bacterium]|nr:hypothetical protein [Synergistaceae bacterium]
MAIIDEHSSKNIKAAAIIAALAFIVSALIFMNMTYSSVRKDIFASMHDLERQNVLVIRQSFDISKDFVSSISINLGRMTEDLNSPEAIKYIREHNWLADFGALYLIKRDGNMYFGSVNSETEKKYYTDLMSQNSSYADIKVFNLETCNYIAINAPVIHNDDIVGVLSARLYKDRLNKLVTFDIFKGTGYNYLLSRDGSILARSDHPIVNKKATTLEEIFSAPGRNDWKIYYTAIADGMEKGVSGEMIYPAINGNRAVCYMPIGIAGMYLITSVPEDVVFSAATEHFFKGLAFVLFSLIILSLLVWCFFNAMKKNTEIIKNTNRELSLVYDNMPGGMVRYVLDGKKWKIKSANKGFFDIIGCSE